MEAYISETFKTSIRDLFIYYDLTNSFPTLAPNYYLPAPELRNTGLFNY